jgi:hypothetical protein
MKTLLNYLLIIAAVILPYSIASAQQDGTPIFRQDSVKVARVKKDSLKFLPGGPEWRRGLLFKNTKDDSTKSK